MRYCSHRPVAAECALCYQDGGCPGHQRLSVERYIELAFQRARQLKWDEGRAQNDPLTFSLQQTMLDMRSEIWVAD